MEGVYAILRDLKERGPDDPLGSMLSIGILRRRLAENQLLDISEEYAIKQLRAMDNDLVDAQRAIELHLDGRKKALEETGRLNVDDEREFLRRMESPEAQYSHNLLDHLEISEERLKEISSKGKGSTIGGWIDSTITKELYGASESQLCASALYKYHVLLNEFRERRAAHYREIRQHQDLSDEQIAVCMREFDAQESDRLHERPVTEKLSDYAARIFMLDRYRTRMSKRVIHTEEAQLAAFRSIFVKPGHLDTLKINDPFAHLLDHVEKAQFGQPVNLPKSEPVKPDWGAASSSSTNNQSERNSATTKTPPGSTAQSESLHEATSKKYHLMVVDLSSSSFINSFAGSSTLAKNRNLDPTVESDDEDELFNAPARGDIDQVPLMDLASPSETQELKNAGKPDHSSTFTTSATGDLDQVGVIDVASLPKTQSLQPLVESKFTSSTIPCTSENLDPNFPGTPSAITKRSSVIESGIMEDPKIEGGIMEGPKVEGDIEEVSPLIKGIRRTVKAMKEYQARGGKFPPLQKDKAGNYILDGYYKDEKGNWIRRNSPASSMATQDNERTLEALTVVEDKKGKGKELSTIDSPASSVSTQVIENTFEALTVVEDKKGKGKELSATGSPSFSMVKQNGKHIPKAMVVKNKKDIGKKVAKHGSSASGIPKQDTQRGLEATVVEKKNGKAKDVSDYDRPSSSIPTPEDETPCQSFCDPTKEKKGAEDEFDPELLARLRAQHGQVDDESKAIENAINWYLTREKYNGFLPRPHTKIKCPLKCTAKQHKEMIDMMLGIGSTYFQLKAAERMRKQAQAALSRGSGYATEVSGPSNSTSAQASGSQAGGSQAGESQAKGKSKKKKSNKKKNDNTVLSTASTAVSNPSAFPNARPDYDWTASGYKDVISEFDDIYIDMETVKLHEELYRLKVRISGPDITIPNDLDEAKAHLKATYPMESDWSVTAVTICGGSAALACAFCFAAETPIKAYLAKKGVVAKQTAIDAEAFRFGVRAYDMQIKMLKEG